MRPYQTIIQQKFKLHHQLRHMKGTKVTKTFSSCQFSTEAATATPHYREEPWKYVTGVSKKDLESNPLLQKYMEANFSDTDLSRKGGDVTILTDIEIEAAEKKAAKIKRQQELHPLLHLGIRSLDCYTRDLKTEEGSRVSRRFRAQSLIPGVIYGQESKSKKSARDRVGVLTPWNLLQREMDLYQNRFTSRVYELTLMSRDDNNDIISKELVVPTDMQIHPIKNALNSLNYLRYFPGRAVNIPVKYVNQDESQMIRQGALVLPLKRIVPLIFEDGASFPDWLEVDCSGIKKMGGIGLDRVTLPDGAKFSNKVPSNMILGTVWGGKARISDDEGEEAEDA